MRIQETRWVHTGVDETFQYTADFANIENWDPGVVSSQRANDGPIGVGATFDLTVRFGSKDLPMQYVVTEWEPMRKVVLRGTGESLIAVDTIEFAPEDEGTRVDYAAEFEFSNYLRWLAPLMRPIFTRVGTKAMDGLVAALKQ